jgi:hypothetical protein
MMHASILSFLWYLISQNSNFLLYLLLRVYKGATHIVRFNKQGFIYLFLLERVRLVRDLTIKRYKDRIYLLNTAGLLLWIVIVVLGVIFRVSKIDENSRCYIGSRRDWTVTLILIYDIVFNVVAF